MANYYRFREKYFTGWWGLGVSYVGNEVNSYGFTYALGIEVYPLKPVSFHLSWKESFINENSIGEFKSQVKYHFKKLALYSVFHHNNVAGEIIKAPVIGLEFSF